MALVRVKNTETGEVLEIGEEHLARWPEDPYQRVDGEPSREPKPDTAATRWADQSSGSFSPNN